MNENVRRPEIATLPLITEDAVLEAPIGLYRIGREEAGVLVPITDTLDDVYDPINDTFRRNVQCTLVARVRESVDMPLPIGMLRAFRQDGRDVLIDWAVV